MDSIKKIISIISKDIFFIRCANDKYIISLPLRGIAFYSNKKGVNEFQKVLSGNYASVNQELKEYLIQIYNTPASPIPTKKPKDIFGPSISIILHQMCNFECSYCFAHEARGKETLSKEDISFIVDLWKKNTPEHKQITFIGGGEPTLNWDLLKWSILYIRKVLSKEGIIINLVTNGSLISHERLLFLKTEKVNISLSFDILPDVQESQRKYYNSKKSSFMAVDSFLKDTVSSDYSCEIRCTITPKIVDRMTEMVEYVHNNYPTVRRIHFEHVTSANNTPQFFERYTDCFFKARAEGVKMGIHVFNSLTTSQGKIRSSFCIGTNCFVPTSENGIICTSCHRVSSNNDLLIDFFKDAEIINHGKIARFDAPHNKVRGIFKECVSCPAKWQCAGGCLMERQLLTKKMIKEKCNMVRAFNKRLLEEFLNA